MPAPTYRLTPDAQADLLEIRQYSIQQWGTDQARKYVIYYIVHKQQIVIFAVLHKRMVPMNHLLERSKNQYEL